jgi:hypothetical protein
MANLNERNTSFNATDHLQAFLTLNKISDVGPVAKAGLWPEKCFQKQAN